MLTLSSGSWAIPSPKRTLYNRIQFGSTQTERDQFKPLETGQSLTIVSKEKTSQKMTHTEQIQENKAALLKSKISTNTNSAIPEPLRAKLQNAVTLLYGKHQTADVLQQIDKIIQENRKNRPKDLLKEDFSRPSNWHQFESVYSFYPDRFGTVEGKPTTFKTMIPMLNYLKDLGVSTLYILPFMKSPMVDAGFDISDFRQVRDNLGGNQEFDDFVAAAKKQGFKLKTDLVLNHVSDKHPWFQAALKGDPEKLKYFITQDTEPVFKKKFSKSKAPRVYAIYKESSGLDTKRELIFPDICENHYRKDLINGKEKYFYHTFYPHQPDLNWKNPQVLYEGLKIMGYWANKGIDIFRMDAIRHFIKHPGTKAENLTETHALTQILGLALQVMSPRSILWMEVYGPHKKVRPYYGEDKTYQMNIGEKIKTITRTDKGQVCYDFASMPTLVNTLVQGDCTAFWDSVKKRPTIPGSTSWGNFLRMHDNEMRLSNLLNHSSDRVAQAYSILHSLPGIPMIYYGDEILMKNNPQFAEQIAKERHQNSLLNKNLTSTKSFFDARDTVRSPIARESFIEASKLKNSSTGQVYQQVKKCQKLRRENPALVLGDLERIPTTSNTTFSYIRSHNGEKILVVNNLSGDFSYAGLTLPEHLKLKSDTRTLHDLLSDKQRALNIIPSTDNELEINMKPYESLWLKISDSNIIGQTRKILSHL